MFGIEEDFKQLMEQVYGPLDGGKMTEIEQVFGRHLAIVPYAHILKSASHMHAL